MRNDTASTDLEAVTAKIADMAARGLLPPSHLAEIVRQETCLDFDIWAKATEKIAKDRWEERQGKKRTVPPPSYDYGDEPF